MCPLRFILVFFSAILAAYLAWNSLTPSQECTSSEDLSQHEDETSSAKHKQRSHVFKMMQNGFWVLIDMASGRHLLRSIKQIQGTGSVKGSSKLEFQPITDSVEMTLISTCLKPLRTSTCGSVYGKNCVCSHS